MTVLAIVLFLALVAVIWLSLYIVDLKAEIIALNEDNEHQSNENQSLIKRIDSLNHNIDAQTEIITSQRYRIADLESHAGK